MAEADEGPIGPAFRRRAARAKAAFDARYGVTPGDAWTDEQMDLALADHGMPPISALPGEPRGMMREFADDLRPEAELTPIERYRHRRTNATHLLGHIMIHDGQRCPGCEDW